MAVDWLKYYGILKNREDTQLIIEANFHGISKDHLYK